MRDLAGSNVNALPMWTSPLVTRKKKGKKFEARNFCKGLIQMNAEMGEKSQSSWIY